MAPNPGSYGPLDSGEFEPSPEWVLQEMVAQEVR